MKVLGRLLPLILLGLLPGVGVKADPSLHRLHLVTLEITDEVMKLNYRAPDGSINTGPKMSIRSKPMLFTPLPGIDRNISSVRMLLQMLAPPVPEDSEETTDRPQHWVTLVGKYLEEASSDGEEIGLYIGAAGYGKAAKARLQDVVKKADSSRTYAEALREDLTSNLGTGFVDDITTAGCFNTDNKAEFQGCALRRILGKRLGQTFTRENTSVNPPSVHQNRLANRVRMKLKISSSLYVLVAGSSVDIMAKQGDLLLELPAWKRGRITPFGYARIGGTYEAGYLYAKEMIAVPYDQALAKAKAETPPRDLSKEDFLNNSTQPLTMMVRTLMHFHSNKSGPYTVNNQEQSPAQMMARLYTSRDNSLPELITGKDFESFGYLISESAKEGAKELTGLQKESVEKGLTEARKIVKQVSRSLAEVLVLFAGLAGPVMKDSPELLVIGEHRESYAANLGEALPELASDQAFIKELYGHYKFLLEANFSAFDAVSPNPRDPAVHLTAGLTEIQFQNWLERLLTSFGGVHQLTEKEYEDLTVRAMVASYLHATSQ
ncbi:MAG: hypothetical protein ACR2PT_01765 [Endozoicomonas sp.]